MSACISIVEVPRRCCRNSFSLLPSYVSIFVCPRRLSHFFYCNTGNVSVSFVFSLRRYVMLTICLLVSLSFLSTATAESSDSFADLVAFHANRVRDRRNVNDKNMSAVGVGGFWDEDHVLKMLGIEDADSVGSTSTDLQRNEGQ